MNISNWEEGDTKVHHFQQIGMGVFDNFYPYPPVGTSKPSNDNKCFNLKLISELYYPYMIYKL